MGILGVVFACLPVTLFDSKWCPMSYLKALIFLLVLVSCAGAEAAVSFYEIPAQPEASAPSAHLERYIDETRTRGLEEVADAPFEPVRDFMSRRYSGDVVWYRFGLHESLSGIGRVLEFGSPYLNNIDVYLLKEGQHPADARYFRFGDHVPMSERPTRTRGYKLPLDLERGEGVTVYLRAESNSAMTLYALLWNSEDYEQHHAQLALVHGVYFGLLGVLCLVFLPLSLLFRRREFMAFSTLAMALVLLNLGTYGYVRVLVPEAQPWLPDAVTGIGALGLVVGSGLVFITLLNLRQTFPLLYRVQLVAIAVALTGMPFVTTDIYRHFAQNVLSFTSLLNVPLTFFALHLAWKLREVAMTIYATGFVITVTGGTIVMLAVMGIIPSSDWTLAAYQISTLIQMILLALGLGIEWKRSLQDKTMLKERAMLAESRTELLHNLTRFLSHELITPLAAAKRAVEMVERQQGGISEVNRERLQRAGRRLADIAGMVQAFLGREGREGLLQTGGFTLSQLVKRSLEMVGESHERCEITYEVDGDTPVSGAHSLLSHALRNLVDNGLRHSGEAMCRLVVTSERGRLVIRVEDQGPGLDMATLERVNTGRSNDNNEISGLMLVRFFMELQGGELQLRNRREGGLEASLYLPKRYKSKDM